MNRLKRNKLLVAVSALLLFGAVGVQSVFAQVVSIHVPVIINLQKGSGTTEQEAKDAIKEANKILKQAGMILVPVETNTPGVGTDPDGGDNGGGPGGVAKDGNFTRAERDNMRTFGGKELKDLPNEKGLKVTFGNQPVSGSGTKGVSVKGNPTIIVRESTDGEGGAVDTGQTIAHEFGHVLGLDHLNEAGNCMHETASGTKLTADQIKTMRKNKYKHGKCTVQWDNAYPAKKVAQQYGATTDDTNDLSIPTAHPNLDLNRVVLTSLAESDHMEGNYANIHIDISVVGDLPVPQSPDQFLIHTYALGIDTDNNSFTGELFGNTPGIDNILWLDLIHEYGPDGPTIYPILWAQNNFSGLTVDLPPLYYPQITVENEFHVLGEPPVLTRFTMDIPKCILGLSPLNLQEHPAVVVSFDNYVPVDQTIDLTFDQNRWNEDPTILTYGNGVPQPGLPYPISVFGLEPGSLVELFVDDDLQPFSGIVDAYGEIHFDFQFPSNLSVFEPHFLTVQDNTGEFAYGMTCPQPTLPSDFDKDGDVDLIDFATFASQYLHDPF